MPKAGKYDYPTRDLDDCISYLQKAYDVAKEQVFKRNAFAEALDQAPRGGNFNLLVGSLSLYNLVETGEGEIRYTELAKLILHGDDTEQTSAKSKAVRNVTLLADIFDKFGTNPDEKNLKHFLREKAKVDIAEVNDTAVAVGKLFKKVAKHLRPVEKESKQQDGENKGMTFGASITTEPTSKGLFTVYADGLQIDVDNLLKLGMVEQLVKNAKEELSKQKSNKGEKMEVNEE